MLPSSQSNSPSLSGQSGTDLRPLNSPGLSGKRAVLHAVELLGDTDPAIKSRAIQVIAEQGDAQVIETLVSILTNPSTRDNDLHRAIRGLGRLHAVDAVPAILDTLSRSRYRLLAIHAALTAINLPETADLLRLKLADPRTDIREAACRLSATLVLPGLIEALFALLEGDGSPAVYREAAAALGRYPTEDVIGLIMELATRDVEGFIRAGDALIELRAGQGVEAARLYLNHQNDNVREMAIRVLGANRSDEARDLLFIQLNDQDPTNRMLAINGLLNKIRRGDIAPVAEMLSDDSAMVRYAALMGMVRHLDDDSIRVQVETLLKDPEPYIQREAAYLLGC